MIDPALARAAREAPYLGAEQEREVVVRAQAGDAAARDLLVRSHLRLVIQLAQKRRGYAVAVEDLIQEGSAGLVGAIGKFDTAAGVRFATYATWWIKAAMNDAAMRGHSIVRRNTTAAAKAMFFSLRRAREALERDGRLTEGEVVDRLAARFGVEPGAVRDTMAWLGQGDTALDAPIGEDGDMTVVDTLVDDGPLPDACTAIRIDGAGISAALGAALDSLKDRERAIVTARRFVYDGDEQTLDELGARFGITRERVRQIEARGLEKLRAFLERAGVGPEALAA